MKLLRYGEKGLEKPGLLDAANQIRDLSAHVKDIAGDVLSPAGLQAWLRWIPRACLWFRANHASGRVSGRSASSSA